VVGVISKDGKSLSLWKPIESLTIQSKELPQELKDSLFSVIRILDSRLNDMFIFSINLRQKTNTASVFVKSVQADSVAFGRVQTK